MSRRIAVWALAGFSVACIWVIVSLLIPRGVQFGKWPITAITAPASIIGRMARFPMTWYEFIALNAALYTAVGLAFEPVRCLIHRPKPRLSS